MTGPSALGTTCRTMMRDYRRRQPAPQTAMKSRSRMLSTSARTSRAYEAQTLTPMTMMVVLRLGENTAESVTSSTSNGNAMSVSDDARQHESIQPPK